jgi:hypothetical protein
MYHMSGRRCRRVPRVWIKFGTSLSGDNLEINSIVNADRLRKFG